MVTSRNCKHQLSLNLTYGVQDGHVKISAKPTQIGKDYLDKEVDSSTPLWNSLKKFSHNGWSWKTSQACYLPKQGKLLSELSTNWKRVGIWGAGYRATLDMRAYPTTEIDCSLLQVLDQTVPIESLLTAANCLGILRRENRAKRKLDPIFVKALSDTLRLWYNVAVASGTPWQEASAPRYVPKLESIKAVIQTGQYYVARNLTWTEWERLMGFPPGWTDVEGD